MSHIELKNICKCYKKNNVNALNNINVKFEMGKFYAIVGKSGSGKSTLIQIIGLLDNASNGEILYDSDNMNKLDEKEKSVFRLKKFGFIFQSYHLDTALKAYENVMLPMLINDQIAKDERKNKALNLLSMLKVKDRMNHYPKELSGGEQQRIAIARALANNPDFILADEPTGNLDSENEEMVLEILKKLSQNGKGVVMVTHSKNALKYADEVLYMCKGELKHES